MQIKINSKPVLFTFLLLLICEMCFSQENYLPGYIVKLNRDTLRCFIDYRNWDANPFQINYMEKIESNSITCKSTEILAFKVHDEMYVSAIVNVETSPDQLEKLTTFPTPQIESDKVFLQTLLNGNKSLYFYKNSNGKENYYVKQDTGFELLIYKRYSGIQDGTSVIKENKRFLGQLTLYLKDCTDIRSKLENTSYDQGSLTSLFKYYYKCTKSESDFQFKEEKQPIETGLLAGLTLSKLNFTSSVFDYLSNANYNQSTDFSAGLFVNIPLPRNLGKWSIDNQLLYTAFKVKGHYDFYQDANNYSSTASQFGYSYLKLNTLIRFKNPVGKLFFYMEGGISNGFVLSETNYKKQNALNYIYVINFEGKALEDTRKYEQGLVLGSGLQYDKCSFEFLFENGNGFSNYSNLTSTTKRFYFLFGYRF